ncbi:plastocyanin/azurin family copper-binding protein [Kallotenue papyrolyticum]|uniref:plastocyanin/azurin family copper-binding protein n=1 Tax=Kallotenue papyrolyticum TaxID=1325125 RepID=UPI000492AEA8|nr:plastocyanin/azurin family copper-binding protein [Kallotenue papyrolyticum]
MNLRRWFGGATLVALLALTACGGGGGTATGNQGANASPAAGGSQGASLTVAGTDTLKFEPATLTAPAGQDLTVTFNNPSSQPHNWVLVEPGQEAAVAQAALANGGEVTADTPGVIAATKILQAGQNETISVPALQAGTYQYICTFPGHYQAGMVGTLTVQ